MPNNNSDNKLSSSIITNSDNKLNNSIKIVEKFNNTTYFTFTNILIGTLLIFGLYYNHKMIPLIKNKILIAICSLLIYIILLNIIIFIK